MNVGVLPYISIGSRSMRPAALTPGRCVDPLLERPVKIGLHVAPLIGGRGKIDLEGENVCWVEAQINVTIARHHANQHPRDHQQDESERDLSDHEAGTQPVLSALGPGTAAALQGAIGIDAGKTQSREERSNQAGNNGNANRGGREPSNSCECPHRAPEP